MVRGPLTVRRLKTDGSSEIFDAQSCTFLYPLLLKLTPFTYVADGFPSRLPSDGPLSPA